MEIELTIKLTLPDDLDERFLADGGMNPYMREMLFDAYINHNTVCHFGEAIKWAANARMGSIEEGVTAGTIYHYHDLWGGICSGAEWDYRVNGGV